MNQPIVAPESKDSPVPSAGVEMGAALTEEDMMAKTPMNQPTVAPESEVSPVPSAGEDGDPLVEPEVPANRAAQNLSWNQEMRPFWWLLQVMTNFPLRMRSLLRHMPRSLSKSKHLTMA